GGTDSGDIRKIVWTGAYNVWRRYPLFGSGVETFAYSYYQDRPAEHNLVSEWDFLYNKAHNEFLNFLATTGIAGFAAYCLFLGSCVWLYMRLVYQKHNDAQSITQWYGLAFLSATVALTISNFFGFSTVVVAILLFLFPALAVVAFQGETAPVQKANLMATPSHSATLSIFTILALIAIFSLATIFRYWSADVDYTAGKSALREGKLREGFTKLEQAITKNPQEALFIDTLASEYASYAVQFAQAGQATTAAQLATQSVSYIRKTLELNPRQLNFYKTSARSLILLSQFDDQYLQAAQEVLTSARVIAPTDPKVIYNLGLVEIGLGNREKGISLLEETVQLKPNYDTVRAQLAVEYEKMGNYQQAVEQLKYIVEYINPNVADVQQKIASLSAQIQKKQ
ncbi:O-antigen ligase family protein, partial [Candidatus Woesebacteria bacterium]|nr:O-antigen ligase family protein [Candidatus Woesebacteria bacterium]